MNEAKVDELEDVDGTWLERYVMSRIVEWFCNSAFGNIVPSPGSSLTISATSSSLCCFWYPSKFCDQTPSWMFDIEALNRFMGRILSDKRKRR